MPGGHKYEGPAEALALYTAAIEAAHADVAVKGAKNPYTSCNGHMFSFLDGEGTMALRLSDELNDEFNGLYESGPVIQYGSVMRGYVAVPEELLADTDAIAGWFDRAFDWISSVPPKPSKK